ncbi:hypothetical protein Dimus_008313, partial [Dionaea muscipula]
GMDFTGILTVVNEQGGVHINKSFQPLMDSTSRAAGTSDVPVQKASRKKKTGASETGTFATTAMADVGEKEISAEGNVGATQESEFVAAKGKSKLRPQRRRRKDVISPMVGENLVEEEVGDGEGLEVTKRRCLRKATSTEVDAAVDSEETESDEDVRKLASDSDVNNEGQSNKRRQKQIARTGPSKRPRKAKSLHASEAEHKVEGLSDQIVGSDGGVSREEMEGGDVPKAFKVEEDEEDDVIVRREGKGPIMEFGGKGKDQSWRRRRRRRRGRRRRRSRRRRRKKKKKKKKMWALMMLWVKDHPPESCI